MRNFSIKTKLFTLVFSVTFIVLSALNYYSIKSYEKTVENNFFEHLDTARDLHADMILSLLSERTSDLKDSSQSIISELNELEVDDPFLRLKHISQLDKANKLSSLNHEDLDVYRDISGISQTLMKHARADNLYIINDDGDIVFSSENLGDSLKNVFNSYFDGEGLTNCIKRMKLKESQGDENVFSITDLGRYHYYSDIPVLFIGYQVKINNHSAYLVLMMTNKEINDVMTMRSGMGRSGETYLVGKDFRMRSESRFLTQEPEHFYKELSVIGEPQSNIDLIKKSGSTVLLKKVETKASIEAFKGESGNKIIKDYRGVSVLSSYKRFKFGNNEWAIIAEIDENETFSDISKHKLELTIFSSILIVFSIILTYFLVNMLSARMLILKAAAKKVSHGDYDLDLKVKGTDEIDSVMNAFGKMAVKIKNMQNDMMLKR